MGRAPCCDKANVKKGPWSPEEDSKLKAYIEQHGTGGNWIALPQKIGLKRCGKSCRLRWLNYLRPNIKHGGFSEAEENVICSLYISIGSRWSIIAAQLPGRTDNDIKNYWNTRLKKKLLGKQRKDQALRRPTLDQEMIMMMKTEQDSLLSAQQDVNYETQFVWSSYPSIPHLEAEAANKNLFCKNGRRIVDDHHFYMEAPNSITSASTPLESITMFPSSSSASASSMESLQSHFQDANYKADGRANGFHGLEDLQEELDALAVINQSGFEEFYGMSPTGGSWENSLAYYQLVSEYENCLQNLRQNSPYQQ